MNIQKKLYNMIIATAAILLQSINSFILEVPQQFAYQTVASSISK